MARAERTGDGAGARRPRTTVVVVTLAVLLTGGVGAGLVWAGSGGGQDTASKNTLRVKTVAVTRTNLSDTRQMEGTLGFGASRSLKGADGGRVTWLPAVGTTVKRGKQLYRVDDRPVVVFYGSTPMYRRLDTVGSVGRDVRVVADNLRALGYDIGTQPTPGTLVQPEAPRETAAPGTSAPKGRETAEKDPAPGSSGSPDAGKGAAEPAGPSSAAPSPIRVKRGDGVLTASLIAAIKRWQPTAGMQPTGVLDIPDVVVTVGAVRVGNLKARLGDDSSADVMTVTATDKTVTVPVDALDMGTIQRNEQVGVTLPDQSTTAGKVEEISTIINSAGDEGGADGSPAQLNVTVSLKDLRAVRDVDAAKVQVQFEAETRKNVLVVPIGALLALSEGGYGVQIPGGKLVAVRTGLFAKGLVEVSGSGITEGTKVETTS